MTKQELLLEEYKIGLDAYYRSEAIYATRENFFFVGMGIIVAAVFEILKNFNNNSLIFLLTLVGSVVSILGICLSIIWYKIQEKSFSMGVKRLNRLKQIENEIMDSSLPNNEEIFKFLTITNRDEEGIPYEKTSRLRNYIPKIFLGLFLILLFSIIIQFVCQRIWNL